jgi:hypothetical protein
LINGSFIAHLPYRSSLSGWKLSIYWIPTVQWQLNLDRILGDFVGAALAAIRNLNHTIAAKAAPTMCSPSYNQINYYYWNTKTDSN